MSISVALAAYNGEKYIAEQIESVLSQLGEDDDIIVSDDNPAGKTKEAVLSFSDPRIKYVEGKGLGVVKNFENALSLCKGDYIYLCDQDDVWMPDKVKKVQAGFENGADLVLHNALITDESLNSAGKTSFDLYNPNTSFFGNLAKNTFVGCCMAFRREVLGFALPFPDKLPMHDWWIALLSIRSKHKISLIEEPLIKWRRHEGNVTGNSTSLSQKIMFRLHIIGCLITVCRGKDRSNG